VRGRVSILVQDKPVQGTEIALFAAQAVDDTVATVVRLGTTQGATARAHVAIQNTEVALLGTVDLSIATERAPQAARGATAVGVIGVGA
jgi:uncharacterized protein (UPF0254 family)